MKTYLVSLPDGGTAALIFTLSLRINFKNKENAKGRGFVSSPQQRADVLTPPPYVTAFPSKYLRCPSQKPYFTAWLHSQRPRN